MCAPSCQRSLPCNEDQVMLHQPQCPQASHIQSFVVCKKLDCLQSLLASQPYANGMQCILKLLFLLPTGTCVSRQVHCRCLSASINSSAILVPPPARASALQPLKAFFGFYPCTHHHCVAHSCPTVVTAPYCMQNRRIWDRGGLIH